MPVGETSPPTGGALCLLPTPKERIWQSANRDRWTKGTEIRQKPIVSRERTPVPIRERTLESIHANTALPFSPQERMKQKTVSELLETHVEQRRELSSLRKGAVAIPQPIAHFTERTGPKPGAKPVSPSHESVPNVLPHRKKSGREERFIPKQEKLSTPRPLVSCS